MHLDLTDLRLIASVVVIVLIIVVGVALFLNFFAPLLPGYLFEHVALWDLSVRGILMENTEPLVSGGSLRELGAPFFELRPETVSVSMCFEWSDLDAKAGYRLPSVEWEDGPLDTV